MKTRINNAKAAVAISVLTLSFYSCEDYLISPVIQSKSLVQSQPSATLATIDIPNRTLASNCFQCHGTDGFAGELKIASMSKAELVSKLNSFRAKDPKADIMNFHALGYTPTEIDLIADYFSKQQ